MFSRIKVEYPASMICDMYISVGKDRDGEEIKRLRY